MTNSPHNLPVDTGSRGTCSVAPQGSGFLHHTWFFKLLNNFLGAGPGVKLEYQPGQCPAQPPHHCLQCHLGVPRGHCTARISCTRISHLSCSCKEIVMCSGGVCSPTQCRHFCPGNTILEYGRRLSWHFRCWQDGSCWMITLFSLYFPACQLADESLSSKTPSSLGSWGFLDV